MGNIEKLVVLTVLFLSAIVLAVSLNEEQEPGTDSTPLGAATELLRQDLPETAPADPQEGTSPRPGLLLDAGLEGGPLSRELAPRLPEPEAAPGGVEPDGRKRLLRTEVGLTLSPLADYRVHRVEADGATWAELCERFYGTRDHLDLLRTANEGLVELHAGDRILVPIYDLEVEAGEREPYRPVERTAAAEKGAATGPRTYVVRDGDSLWTIAEAVYGKGSRWQEIFEANRKLLPAADRLTVGDTLVIP